MARTNLLWFGTWGAIALAVWFIAPAAWGGPLDKIRDIHHPGRTLIQDRFPTPLIAEHMESLIPSGDGLGGSVGGSGSGSGSGSGNPSWTDVADTIHDIAGAMNHMHGVLGGRGPGRHGRPNRGGGGWYPVPMPRSGYYPSHAGSGTVVIPADIGHSIGIPGNPLPAATVPNRTAGHGLTLVNPAATGGSVRFRIGGRTMELASGYQQALDGGVKRVIEFDRGGDFGLARYTLAEGTYQFKVTDRGWDIVKKVYRITIDNRAGRSDFRYLIDNRAMMIAAGQVRQHKGSFPFTVKFDNGRDGEPVAKVLKQGTYRVGIHSETGLWDLLPNEPVDRFIETSRPDATITLANPLP